MTISQDEEKKHCRRCGMDFPATTEHFYKDKKGKNGLHAYCKRCTIELEQSRQRGNVDKARALPKSGVVEGQKQCQQCKKWFPATIEYFHTSKTNTTSGLHSYCKSCCLEADNEWKQNNPEKVREVGRRWKQEHPDRVKQYYNPGRQRERRIANPEKSREYSARWRKKNPDKIAAKNERRRALEANAEGEFTYKDWRRQYKLQGGLCWWCSRPKRLTVDHVKPLARGGTHYPRNIVLACAKCNCSKGKKLAYSEWQPPKPLQLASPQEAKQE